MSHYFHTREVCHRQEMAARLDTISEAAPGGGGGGGHAGADSSDHAAANEVVVPELDGPDTLPPLWPKRVVIAEGSELQAEGTHEGGDTNHFGIRMDLFNISFVIYVRIEDKKRKRSTHERIKQANLLFPTTTVIRSISLKAFKKLVAGSCASDGLVLARTVMQLKKDVRLTWAFYVNGDHEFACSKRVEIKTDAQLLRFLEVCSISTRTMGVMITMAVPGNAAGDRKKRSALRASVKRANKEYEASSDGGGGPTELSDEATELDCSIADNDAQDLANACVTIRKSLVGGNVSIGEAPYCTDLEMPCRRIRITPALLKLWAGDLVHKVPGVTATVPPIVRPEFRCKYTKRPGGEVAGGDADHNSPGNSPNRSGSDAAWAPVQALAAEVTLGDFLYFANIRVEAKVARLLDILDSLGIDHWSVFLKEACLEPLGEAGVDFGTRQKLVIAAPAYEVMLSRRAGGLLT